MYVHFLFCYYKKNIEDTRGRLEDDKETLEEIQRTHVCFYTLSKYCQILRYSSGRTQRKIWRTQQSENIYQKAKGKQRKRLFTKRIYRKASSSKHDWQLERQDSNSCFNKKRATVGLWQYSWWIPANAGTAPFKKRPSCLFCGEISSKIHSWQ